MGSRYMTFAHITAKSTAGPSVTDAQPFCLKGHCALALRLALLLLHAVCCGCMFGQHRSTKPAPCAATPRCACGCPCMMRPAALPMWVGTPVCGVSPKLIGTDVRAMVPRSELTPLFLGCVGVVVCQTLLCAAMACVGCRTQTHTRGDQAYSSGKLEAFEWKYDKFMAQVGDSLPCMVDPFPPHTHAMSVDSGAYGR